MGRSAFSQLRKGMFVIGRIVPVHPATDAWLVSGHYAAFPKSTGKQVAQTALKTLTAHPELLRRNPDMLRRAWELQAESRADFIALVYDEVEGLTYYRDFGRLDALFADPTLANDRTYLTQLREYLHDDSVSPLAIRRLVQRHPEGADPVFRALLRKPGFSWQRDGEQLLRRRKQAFFDSEPTPSISTVGDRLAELLRIGR